MIVCSSSIFLITSMSILCSSISMLKAFMSIKLFIFILGFFRRPVNWKNSHSRCILGSTFCIHYIYSRLNRARKVYECKYTEVARAAVFWVAVGSDAGGRCKRWKERDVAWSLSIPLWNIFQYEQLFLIFLKKLVEMHFVYVTNCNFAWYNRKIISLLY